MAIENCSGCRFFVPQPDSMASPGDECHASAPVVGANRWPRVYPNEWCGQWVRAERKDVRRVEVAHAGQNSTPV